MAKRKRLTPAQTGFLAPGDGADTPPAPPAARPAPLSPAPIAQVAGEASATAALAELSAEMQAARDEGRLIETLPIAAIDERHLVRDRLIQDEEEMQALMASIRARGQQTPVEVIRLPQPSGGLTHGLISGWRRLSALRRLYKETGEERFATVRARVIAPADAAEAYLAMVEENEIRVNLGHYERARIAVKAMEEGVYPDARAALRGLFGSVSRSKRSKIGSFMGLVTALDDALLFPTAISEKLGLALARTLEEREGLAERLRARLLEAAPKSPEAEAKILTAALSPRFDGKGRGDGEGPAPAPRPQVTRYDITSGLVLRHWPDSGRIELSGDQVDERLLHQLKDWLERR